MHELNFPAGLIRLQYFIQAFESRENAEDIIDKNKHEFYHYNSAFRKRQNSGWVLLKK